MSSDMYHCLYKTLIVGDTGVGKTSLLLKFVDGRFTENYNSTIGVDFKSKILTVDDCKVKLHVWDTSGQERFQSVTRSYYKGAQGVIFTYDVTCAKSFANIKWWIQEVQENAEENIARVMVGTKCDLLQNGHLKTRSSDSSMSNLLSVEGYQMKNQSHQSDIVDTQVAREYSASLGIPLIEVSTRDHVNIEETFTILVREMRKRGPGVASRKSIGLIKAEGTQKNQCCS